MVIIWKEDKQYDGRIFKPVIRPSCCWKLKKGKEFLKSFIQHVINDASCFRSSPSCLSTAAVSSYFLCTEHFFYLFTSTSWWLAAALCAQADTAGSILVKPLVKTDRSVPCQVRRKKNAPLVISWPGSLGTPVAHLGTKWEPWSCVNCFLCFSAE